MIAFRLIFLEFDRDPSVATSLSMSAGCWHPGIIGRESTYHTVATPPSRDVRTCKQKEISWQVLERAMAFNTYFCGCRTWRGDGKMIAKERFFKEITKRPGCAGWKEVGGDRHGKIWKLNSRSVWKKGGGRNRRHDALHSNHLEELTDLSSSSIWSAFEACVYHTRASGLLDQ